MHRRTFLFDVDGVLANFTRAYLDIVEYALNRPRIEESSIDLWDVGDSIDLSNLEKALVHKYLFAPGVAFHMEPYMPTLVVLTEAMKHYGDRLDVALVTSPLEENPTWDHDRRLWVTRWLGDDVRKNTIFTSAKKRVNGHVFVDDKIKNVEEWSNDHPDDLGVVWAQPWNEEFKVRLPNIIRTDDLSWLFYQVLGS